jgi:hypothetical protein
MGSASQLSTAPKTYEVINWLLSSDNEIPERFIIHSTKLNTVVPYITEQLQYKPRLMKYLNTHVNDLYNIPGSIDALVLLKKLFRNFRITKADLRTTRFNPPQRIIETIEKELGYDEGNARSKSIMMQMVGAKIKGPVPAATKANVKKNSSNEVKEITKELLSEHRKKEAHVENSGHYLTELNQEIIDKEELILFDISILEKTNRVLFIFIDKKNHKKYFLKPFAAKIYISKEAGVINNDYIEELDPDKFSGYIINDLRLYNKLKYILGSNYKKVINGVT